MLHLVAYSIRYDVTSRRMERKGEGTRPIPVVIVPPPRRLPTRWL